MKFSHELAVLCFNWILKSYMQRIIPTAVLINSISSNLEQTFIDRSLALSDFFFDRGMMHPNYSSDFISFSNFSFFIFLAAFF